MASSYTKNWIKRHLLSIRAMQINLRLVSEDEIIQFKASSDLVHDSGLSSKELCSSVYCICGLCRGTQCMRHTPASESILSSWTVALALLPIWWGHRTNDHVYVALHHWSGIPGKIYNTRSVMHTENGSPNLFYYTQERGSVDVAAMAAYFAHAGLVQVTAELL
ncbi:hypothetical protein T265_04889 [Opisthorchis viverrini]|uniref:Uncharacterized protein n=1 Tax=Opisthorchis viverrini TaxID=6198 RepID=A0A074ZLJ6_OPIVI|nr:hypothetical protein T265_04889 [Opisthorchis viverrini]KER28213.1 hypothetical protein T265_04889 [Opisthorchis viverrini]